MHKSSLDLMRYAVSRYAPHQPKSLCYDVGSYNVNGSYKQLIEKQGHKYFGIDIRPGPNVDIIVDPKGEWSLPKADFIISGSTLEHVERPWEWILQVKSIAKPGAPVVIIAPNWDGWKEHKHPLDCWRILPDGMKALFNYAGMETLEACNRFRDCLGVARVV